MIKYLYHIKPDNLNGDVLYPLNELKEKYPEIYNKHAEKYSYRKELMEAKLSVANCLWNDVLHFCPVDIGTILTARSAILGSSIKGNFIRRYYRFSIENFQTEKLYVYNTIEASPSVASSIKEMNKKVFLWEEGKNLLTDKITDGQIAYFKKCSEDVSLPRYLFTAIPHVLYLGTLHLSVAEEITYKE